MKDINSIPRISVKEALKTINEYLMLFMPYEEDIRKCEQDNSSGALEWLVASDNEQTNFAAQDLINTGILKPELHLPTKFALMTRLVLSLGYISEEDDNKLLLLASFEACMNDYVSYPNVISFVLLGVKYEDRIPYMYV